MTRLRCRWLLDFGSVLICLISVDNVNDHVVAVVGMNRLGPTPATYVHVCSSGTMGDGGDFDAGYSIVLVDWNYQRQNECAHSRFQGGLGIVVGSNHINGVSASVEIAGIRSCLDEQPSAFAQTSNHDTSANLQLDAV